MNEAPDDLDLVTAATALEGTLRRLREAVELRQQLSAARNRLTLSGGPARA